MRTAFRLLLVLSLGSLVETSVACDTPALNLTSPNGELTLDFCLKNREPHYKVRVKNSEVLSWSRLGLTLKNTPSLTGGFSVQNTARRTVNEVWEQVWGEERHVRNHFNEISLDLVQRADGSGEKKKSHQRNLVVIFRLFNDGLGFRYHIPTQPGLNEFVIMDELTEFNFSRDLQAWWIPAYQDNRYEYLYRKTLVSHMPTAHTPLTLEGDNLHLSVHEANLTDYASMTLKPTGGGRLKADLVPWTNGDRVRAKTPMSSPWRTLQIGATAGDLMTSNLILNLNEPNRLPDTSWIRPMKYIGIWWGMHLDRFTWGSGPKHGATTERTTQYIDFARQLGLPGLLVEGWNYGWDGDWYKNGEIFNFTQPYPDFDLRRLADYAKKNGVELIGHHETGAAIANYERQMEAAFQLYNELGVKSVKTGYVGSRVDGGEWHHGQFMVRHHQLVTETAARYKISLDIHEPIKDTGLRRTYPNLMTREGARGAEYDAWGGHDGNPPDHATILPFTRGLSGPFDYTPGIFDLLTGKTPIDRIRTTLAKQLALYVVIYSPLHMAADLPENYVGHPAFRFIQDVPTDWETTKVVSAVIGDHATVVRKDRNSGDWYLGSLTDEHSREVQVPLSFLNSKVPYCAQIYRDRRDSHYLQAPLGYEIEHRAVRHSDELRLQLAPGGGQAIRFAASGNCPPLKLRFQGRRSSTIF